MSTITVKQLPEKVHRVLKARAKAHGRSLNKEIIAILDSHVHASKVDASEVANRARAVRETMNIFLTQKDLAEFRKSGRS